MTTDEVAKQQLGHEFMRYSRINHLFRTQLADVLPAGLDPAAGQLLAWLVKQGPSRQGELAEYTFLDPSTVSRRISQLVQQGLVERRVDPADGRAVQLVPTARGQELFTSIQRKREAVMHQVLSGWSQPDLAGLCGLLRRFNDDFETFRHQADPPHPAHSPPAAAP